MSPTFAKWGKVHEDKAVFAKVNVDEVPELAEKHRINALPTILIFENGKEVRRWEGFPQENDLVGAL
jgi:thioredoxin 1